MSLIFTITIQSADNIGIGTFCGINFPTNDNARVTATKPSDINIDGAGLYYLPLAVQGVINLIFGGLLLLGVTGN